MTAFELQLDPLPVDDDETVEREKVEWLDATCVGCGKTFRYTAARLDGEKQRLTEQFGSHRAVDVCGAYVCRARRLWSAERWAGQARMAQARAAAGVDPQPLDAEAFERTAR